MIPCSQAYARELLYKYVRIYVHNLYIFDELLPLKN